MSDKNEEDIKLLKNFADICKRGFNQYDQVKEGYAIERVLRRMKELEERYEEQNNELLEWVKQCKNNQTEIDRLYLDKEELEQAYLHEKIAKEEVEELLEDSRPKQKIKEGLDEIEDYFDKLNGPDEDIEYIRKVKKDLLGEGD